MVNVRRHSGEAIPLIQGKEQRLCFAGAAVKRYPRPREEKPKSEGRCCKRATKGRHTETILTEN